MDVLERAQEMERVGESIIHLEIGEPDFETPEAVKQAAVEALKRGETRYTHSLGTRQLREAICEYYARNLRSYPPEPIRCWLLPAVPRPSWWEWAPWWIPATR